MSRHVLSLHPRTVATLGLTLLLSSSLFVSPLKASDPPLLPFNNPGDLLLLDHGCECILRVSPERVVSVHLTSSQIRGVAQVGEVCFEAGGLAFDAEGALYFVEGENQVLKQFNDGRLVRLARRDFFLSLQGVGEVRLANIVVGSDGFLYLTDSQNDSLIRVDREEGSLAIVTNRSELFDTLGFGVMNLEEGSNQLDLTLCDKSGKKLATAQIQLSAMGHRALFLQEIDWQPEAGVVPDFSDFEGLLKVSASGQTAATVLLTQPGVLATQPVVPPL